MYVRLRVYCSHVRLIGNYLQAQNDDVARSFSRENQSERRNGGAGTWQFYSQRKYIILLRATRSRSSGGGDTDRDFNARSNRYWRSTAVAAYIFIYTPVSYKR